MFGGNGMKQYLDLCQHILDKGIIKDDRTGTGTISIFGYQMRFDLQEGFPILTTKTVPFRLVAEELLWFLRGSTNVFELQEKKVGIWDADYKRWVNNGHPDNGDLGPIYGKQWRSWDIGDEWPHSIDQISNVIAEIKSNPDSRRLLVSAWNVGEIDKMGLPPCHYAFQFYVADGKLSCMWQQRSVDTFLGLPFNIASYALLTHMVAKECNLEVGELIFTGGDVHIYKNHLDQINLQLTREPHKLPKLIIKNNPRDIFSYKYEDFELEGYEPDGPIKGDVSVGS
jgi:thymidylate synthase